MWAVLRRDAMTVWQQVEFKERLIHYREIFQGKRIPRYKLARLFYVPFDEYRDKDELMDIHEHNHPKFKKWITEKQHLSLEEIEKEVESLYKGKDLGVTMIFASDMLVSTTSGHTSGGYSIGSRVAYDIMESIRRGVKPRLEHAFIGNNRYTDH